MKAREEPDVPSLDVPDAIANAWAAVYIDVAEKLEAQQQAASAGQQDAQDSRRAGTTTPLPWEGSRWVRRLPPLARGGWGGSGQLVPRVTQSLFATLEKPRVGRRDRVPTAAETEAILAKASPSFRLIYSALRQCGARPGELCLATIADVDRAKCVITLKEHKTARKTGQPRRIPIGRKLGELLALAIGTRTEGPILLSPAGKAWRVPNLSRTYSRLRDQAGLPRDLVLYLARHECRTKICREKGIEFARRLLGHANISTTQRYMHLDDTELADAQDLVE
ncbi:MAG: tyrosine-type recombinase/integrase [Deltaproteobacteria bacterium]